MNRPYDRIMSALVLVILTGICTGCCGSPIPFAFFDDNTPVKKGSIAVISGDPSEPTEKVAEYLTHELKQKSVLRVLSQGEIGRRIGKYPIVIKRMQPAESEDKPVWFAKGEKSKLDTIHDQLKTDYLFVVWITDLSRTTVTSSRGGSRVTYSADVYGNLLEYPRAKAIGYSSVRYSRDKSCCLFGKSEGEDVEELFKYSARDMSEKFLSLSKTGKTEK